MMTVTKIMAVIDDTLDLNSKLYHRNHRWYWIQMRSRYEGVLQLKSGKLICQNIGFTMDMFSCRKYIMSKGFKFQTVNKFYKIFFLTGLLVNYMDNRLVIRHNKIFLSQDLKMNFEYIVPLYLPTYPLCTRWHIRLIPDPSIYSCPQLSFLLLSRFSPFSLDRPLLSFFRSL